VVAAPRPHVGGALLVGAAVGAASASRHAQQQQQQMQQQQQYNAQLAQASAEANAAKAEAEAARMAASAAPAATAVPVQQVYAPAQQQVYAPPPQRSSSAEAGRQMLNQALDGQPGTEDLIALKKQLSVVQVMCDQALQLYHQSMELNKKAGRTNVTGAVMDAGFRRSGGMDAVFDAKRDAETKAAVQPAEKASAMLVEGFKKIPDALRLRYPAEMSRVGDVPMAKLKVGSFGRDLLVGAAFGQTGQNLNDINMARKIRENEEAIARCIATVQEQKHLMSIVQARLDKDIADTQTATARAQTAAIAAPSAAVALPPPPPPALGVPPAIPAQNYVELTSAHMVNESDPAYQAHQIISVPQGAIVKLVRGTLSGGLGAPYDSYVEVEYNGRVGKVSKMVVRPVGGGVPAPLGVPPPLF